MKQIPVALQNHLAQDATTWCFLLKIRCVGKWEGTVLGFTSLDAALTYDDGEGAISYSPDDGFAPEKLEASADFGVDNTDLVGWVSDVGVNEQQIMAGLFDYAEVTIYRVNYMDLSQGHEVVAFGTCGQTKFTDTTWRTEFRSLMQQAKQTISTVYSLTCRAKFGDERCKMPYAWQEGAVQAQGADPQRMFVDAALAQADHYYDLGVIEWLTGNNAGAQMEVDEHLLAGPIRLALPMGYPIQAGDTYRIRQDCLKTLEACKAYNNILNFRGEPLTPVADAGLFIPGVYVTRSDSA